MKINKVLPFVLLLVSLIILGGCMAGGVIVPPTPTATVPPTPTVTAAPTTGSVYGIVSEQGTGIVVPTVSISVDSGASTLTTGADGTYSITGLTPGYHSIKFEKVGYQTKTENVNIVVGVNTQHDVELKNTQGSRHLWVTSDTYIVTGSSVNYGTASNIGLGAYIAGLEARMLIYFNTVHIPTGAKVTSAKLKLYKTSGVGGTSLSCEVHPITEDWSATVATWFARTATLPWFTPGGTYDAQIVGTADIPTAGILDWEEIDITKAFTYWKTNDNNGLIILPTVTTTTGEGFSSSDASSNYPYVEVEYYIP